MRQFFRELSGVLGGIICLFSLVFPSIFFLSCIISIGHMLEVKDYGILGISLFTTISGIIVFLGAALGVYLVDKIMDLFDRL